MLCGVLAARWAPSGVQHGVVLAQLLQRLGQAGSFESKLFHTASAAAGSTSGSCGGAERAAARPSGPRLLAGGAAHMRHGILTGLLAPRGACVYGASFSSAASESSALEVSASESESEGGEAARLSPEEWRRANSMIVMGDNPPAPFTTFEETGFPRDFLRMFARAGFSGPTLIQAQAWPIALEGRDLVAVASTGSGKTCGFLMPAFMHLLNQPGSQGGRLPSRRGPSILVLAPTRELAQQIQKETLSLGAPMRIKAACVYGGASRSIQGQELRRGPQVVIATPGRLLDFVESGEIDLSKV
ncbi:hypothetical protein MNEG_14611 [Monoraphidium neglectum]|uniref:Uncharacterized protein n=1 Tax=Monoraphidium neglectum TaxID=145388 RepID=A0A0D2LUR3_9CHLO|nr:hypothetical protein MNEG_14611 [Monoraphidium neglectum]KIY93351.1 hypothetical protein MNEG_14611 [Monoraphidium neglectum]|eukprot:XP_013892371.1 hypothetical protein MNEG_14611 [Monoraphidium neglectum]